MHNEYLVVWENSWAGGFHDVYARRVSADGRILSWFAVPSNTNKTVNPAVAYDPIHDRYLVVFGYDYYGDGSDWDINGRFIPWDGPDAGLLDFGICTWDSDQKHPAVAYGQSVQEFMVAWVNAPESQPSYVSARRVFAAGGFAPGDGFTVSSGPELRDFPDIAYNLYAQRVPDRLGYGIDRQQHQYWRRPGECFRGAASWRGSLVDRGIYHRRLDGL